MLFGDDGSTSADAAWLWVNSHDWPDWTIDVLRAVDGGPHVDFPDCYCVRRRPAQ